MTEALNNLLYNHMLYSSKNEQKPVTYNVMEESQDDTEQKNKIRHKRIHNK